MNTTHLIESHARVSGIFFAVFLIAASGCKTIGPGGVDPVGVYALVTVNELTLPATVLHGDVAIRIQSGAFRINADGTCSSKVIFGPAAGGVFTRVVKATYTRSGAMLKMQWEGAGTTTGTLHGDTFTMNNEGMVFAYKRVTPRMSTEGNEVLNR